ncbi:fungal specific transcription factor [Colletotrichum tofieldiae]|uniref:Fungal specific transcription factor n=1 Tax=Colletotrichum tofieldiae TaxID=708197 RepID=A0A166NXK6_9PEZI|nr:fungal specific transcription factor [Colletotrichum tofieldiae]
MLLPIYNTFLDELIPVLDGGSMFRGYSNGDVSIYLVRAVCLVACKTKQAAPFLRLHGDGPNLTQADFATKLLTGLDAAMKADLEPDRVTKIQIMALMHLHNDGLGGVDRSSSYLSQAICEAWSISLHVKVPVNADQEECDLLWWALRNFDRLNKPVMGAAPFIIDDTDIGIDRTIPRQDNYRSQLMAVSLRLGDLMTTSTRIYKASSKVTVDDNINFPTFAELTSGIAIDRFNKSHRSYLQIWYHIAAMLSCRYSGPGSVQYMRRLTSADCVLSVITQEGPDNLPPLPLVPYAMSMSTTVIYRALRDGERLPEVAYTDLEACSNNLNVLSQVWSSAKGVAKLVRRLRRYTSPGTFYKHSPNDADCTCESSGPELTNQMSSGSRVSLSDTHGYGRRVDCLQTPVLSVSTLTRARENLAGEDDTDNSALQTPHSETWAGTDLFYSDIDRAFYDFFDYGMPSIFRDPATLDLLQPDDNQGISPFQ